jgi:hypothetical protein
MSYRQSAPDKRYLRSERRRSPEVDQFVLDTVSTAEENRRINGTACDINEIPLLSCAPSGGVWSCSSIRVLSERLESAIASLVGMRGLLFFGGEMLGFSHPAWSCIFRNNLETPIVGYILEPKDGLSC